MFEGGTDDEKKKADESSKLPVKKVRKKRVYTPQQKAAQLRNLALGREKSKIARAKAKKLKELDKLEKYDAEDKRIRDSLNKKQNEEEMQNEIRKLKEQLSQKIPPTIQEEPETPKPKPKRTYKKRTVNKPTLVIEEKEPEPVQPAPAPVQPAQPVQPAPAPQKRRKCGIKGLSLLRRLNQF